MCCAICGHLVHPGEASVATREGTRVHVACADREAAAAWARRRRWALLHALVVIIGVAALLVIGTKPWLLILIATGVLAHPPIHRRWWHYITRDIRTWLSHRWPL